MAAKKTTTKSYISQAKTTKISATSRCAIKTRHEYYYTIEAHEEREIPDSNEVNLNKEWELLFDSVNSVTDKQAEEILKTFNSR